MLTNAGQEWLDKIVAEKRRLSELLWDARETAEMYADTVEHRTGAVDHHDRDLVARIDAYRAEQGWSPDGFGGET